MSERLIMPAVMLLWQANDCLDVSKMNVNPGGKQRVRHDGFWNGKVHPMNYTIGILTKMKVIIEEKSINTKGMNADRMREIL